jgi:DNA-binding CsgD family transcriptional regulator
VAGDVPAVSSTWPLVGREEELERMAQARAGRLCGVMIRAGAGVGKSRLAREELAKAEREGALVEWIQATRSAAMVPLGAFAGVLPDGAGSDQPFNALRTTVERLHEQAAGRPIVLGVDDAHLLDPISAALVLQLATRADAFVLATVRSGEPCPDAIVSLWKDAGAQRLELRRLDDTEVRRLVETALGAPVQEEALRWIVDRSEGNPLYARELVHGAVEAGSLGLERGLWQLSGRPPVRATLMELIGGRMEALTPEQLAPLELLSLTEPLRLEELSELTSYDALADAEAHGLLAVENGSGATEVRLAHALHGDVLRARIPPLRARRLRLALAEALRRREDLTPQDALRVARLLTDAQAPVPSALLSDAARAANLAGDPELGAQLAAQAVAEGGGLGAALALARAHAMCQRFEEAETALAAVEADVPGDPAAISYLEQRVRVLFWGLGRVAATQALIARAAGWCSDAAWQPRLLAVGMPGAVAEDLPGAIAAVETTLADPGLDAESRRLLEPRLAMALFYGGRWDEGQRLARRCRPPIPLRDYAALLTLPALRFCGVESGADWPGMETELARVFSDGVRGHDDEAAGQGALGLGHLAFLRGRLNDAERWLTEAELHFEREDAYGTIADVLAIQIGTAHVAGDDDRAARLLGRLRVLDDTTRPRPLARPAYVLRAEGWVACGRNPAAGAAQLLAGSGRFEADMPGLAALLAYDALLAGIAPSKAGAALRRLAPRCAARLVGVYAAHADALARRDGSGLLQAAEAFAAIGTARYAAIAAAHAAATFLDAGRHDSARRAAVLVRDLHEPGQGTPPPRIDGLDGAATALTTRESQLVGLARRGMTNAEIADRLVLSVRTVESHLYRAMQKLGVNDRRDF